MSTNLKKGVVLALLTAFISGVANFTNKYAVGAITPPLVFTTLKNVGVGLLIVSLLLMNRKWELIKKLNRKELLYLIAIGIVGGSIPFYLYFTGLTMVPAINAAIIHKTFVIWVAILALPFLKERLTRLQILAIILVFLGNLAFGGFNGFIYSRGELLILLATLLWAVENILAKKALSTLDSDVVAAARMGIGSFILLSASLVTEPTALSKTLELDPTQSFWMIVAIVTLMGYVVTWYRALKYAPASLVATVLVSATLVTNILSAVFVTHNLNAQFVFQFVLMTVGILVFIFSLNDALRKRLDTVGG
jgi:drug/metabolite transporter (DMT)-like permease